MMGWRPTIHMWNWMEKDLKKDRLKTEKEMRRQVVEIGSFKERNVRAIKKITFK